MKLNVPDSIDVILLEPSKMHVSWDKTGNATQFAAVQKHATHWTDARRLDEGVEDVTHFRISHNFEVTVEVDSARF